MGNFLSASTATQQEKEQESIRRQYGVLVPPSFIDSSSSSSASTLPSRLTSPNILEALWTMNQGRQLIETYMNPGVTLSVPTATQGQILVALKTTTDSVPSSFLWAEQPISEQVKVELLVPTGGSSNFQLGYRHKFSPKSSSFWSLKSQINTKQQGWVEGRCKSSFQDLELLFSISSYFSSSTKKYSLLDPKTAQLQAAAEYQQSLMAMCGALDENNLPILQSSLISLNLNHQPNINLGETNDEQSVSQAPPPLWLTLKQNRLPDAISKSWVLNLSQMLTFDRSVWNILEERAPKVRQTLGWALQIETMPLLDAQNNPDTTDTKWSMGATWQINRGMALKGIVSSCKSAPLLLEYGMILKRWKQPRATLSILNQFDLDKRSHSFIGFGLELQASPFLLSSATATTYPDAPPADFEVEDYGAPTKVHVPKK
jgi:hypothetical protein